MQEESKEVPQFITQESVNTFDPKKLKALKLEKNIYSSNKTIGENFQDVKSPSK